MIVLLLCASLLTPGSSNAATALGQDEDSAAITAYIGARANDELGEENEDARKVQSVEGGRVRLETQAYGPRDASCCPSVKGATSYSLTGKELKEQKAPSGRRRHT